MHRMVWLSTRLHQPDRQARLQPLAPLPRRFRPRSLKSPRSATPPIPARLGTNTVIGGFHLLIELLVRGDGLVAPAWSNIDHLDWPKELPPTAGVSQSCGGPTSTPLLWQLKKGPSWPRCIGILNGHYSSRALLTATISGSTIACGTGMLAGLDYQDKLARFLENHDEPRAASEFPLATARCGGNHHVFVTRVALFSPGSVRRSAAADTDPSLPRPGRAEEPRNCGFLRQSTASLKEHPGVARWSLVANPAA